MNINKEGWDGIVIDIERMQECHLDGVDFTYANTEGMIIGGKIFDDAE